MFVLPHCHYLNTLKNRKLFITVPVSCCKALVKIYKSRTAHMSQGSSTVSCIENLHSFVVFICLHFFLALLICFFLIFQGPQARTQVSPSNKNWTPRTHSRGKHARFSSLFVHWEPRPGSTAFLITVAPVHCKYDKSKIKMCLYTFRPLQVIWDLFTIKK